MGLLAYHDGGDHGGGDDDAVKFQGRGVGGGGMQLC